MVWGVVVWQQWQQIGMHCEFFGDVFAEIWTDYHWMVDFAMALAFWSVQQIL